MDNSLPQFDNLRNVSLNSHRFNLKVRIISMWKTPTHLLHLVQSCMELILVDKEGVKIQASVCKRHRIQHDVSVGLVYEISKFKVIPNRRSLRFMSHDFRLVFHCGTKFELSVDPSIPRECFSFYDSVHIERSRGTFPCLIDFIGLLAAVSVQRRIVRNNKLTKMIVLELLDSVGKIRCLLMGEFVDRLMLHLGSHWTARPIILLQFVHAHFVLGHMLIQTIDHSSQLFINPGFEAATLFANRLTAEGILTDALVEFIHRVHTAGIPSVSDQMLRIYPKKTIAELLQTPEKGTFIVHACIDALIKDQPWTYASCICYHEMIVRTGVYECLKCQRFFYQMKPRYRMKVEVYDGCEKTVFVLNDPEVCQVMKMCTKEIILNPDAEYDVDFPPDVEERVVGHEMLFKVSSEMGLIFNGEPCYEVKMICSDSDIISAFHSQPSIAEGAEAIVEDAYLTTPKHEANTNGVLPSTAN